MKNYTTVLRRLFGCLFALAIVTPALLATPVIVTPPHDVTAAVNATTNLTVVATGNGTLIYHWRQNNTPVPGTTSSLNFSPVSDSQGGSYVVIVTESIGGASVTS